MLVAAAYEWFARGDTVLDADLRVHQLEMPGHGRHRLGARPWPSLELAGDGRFGATWDTEPGVAGRPAWPAPDPGG